jgi:hypothetical protein
VVGCLWAHGRDDPEEKHNSGVGNRVLFKKRAVRAKVKREDSRYTQMSTLRSLPPPLAGRI